MTNKCTIISQIITLLHVVTLSRHPQGACQVTHVFQMQLLVIQFTIKMLHIGFYASSHIIYVCVCHTIYINI